jgi:hypothetical protein
MDIAHVALVLGWRPELTIKFAVPGDVPNHIRR